MMYGMTDTTGQPPTTAELVLALKQRVGAIRKEERNKDQNFNFRGIDTVINTVGPIERELGLFVYPEVVDVATDQHTYGSRGTLGFRTRVQVRFHWVGPRRGDELIVGPVAAEAIDTGDKGTAKAMSVALRTMYLQTLTIPTDEPDPDATSYQVIPPEPAASNPEVLADLTNRVNNATDADSLRSAFDLIGVEYQSDRSNITTADYEQLKELVRKRKSEVKGS